MRFTRASRASSPAQLPATASARSPSPGESEAHESVKGHPEPIRRKVKNEEVTSPPPLMLTLPVRAQASFTAVLPG